ncbi:MAG: ABC transporter permease [Pseudoxanthomonas sp.]
MNAVTAAHKTNTFKWLLKREFWENRGGFFWAPAITSAIMILLGVLGTITSVVLLRHAVSSGKIDINGLIADSHDGQDRTNYVFGLAGDLHLLSGVAYTSIVLVFVVFFYALGSLYEERKDRSVLFWKSLPLSDTATALSKVAWALLLAPTLSIVIGILSGLALWLVSAAGMAFADIPGAGGIFAHSHPLRVLGNLLLVIPVYAFWVLPTVGWLMLCSAWARSKPFLWAVLVPLLASTVISWLGTLPGISIAHGKVWYVLGFRSLLSVVPGSWYLNPHVSPPGTHLSTADGLARSIDLSTSWQAFATADLWIGAIIGAALIAAAIYLRRWRELAD